MKFRSFLLALCVTPLALAQDSPDPMADVCYFYPRIEADHSLVDDYFGTKIADPYRALEDDLSHATAAWVKAQNELTEEQLARIPYRDAIRKRLEELYDYPKFGTPSIYGDYTIFSKNDGLQNHGIIYKQKKGSDKAEVLFDPNSFSEDGTQSLAGMSISKDNSKVAYAISASGSDWVTMRVRDMENGKDFDDKLEWMKSSRVAWCGDGFYYSRYDKPAGSALSSKNEFAKIFYHKLGTKQSDDVLIYQDKEHALRSFGASLSDDEKYLFIYATEGTSGVEILYKERASDEPFKVLFKGFDYDYSILGVKGDTAYYTTNESPNGAIHCVDLTTGKTSQLIPEKKFPLEDYSMTDYGLYLSYLENASTKVYQYGFDGKQIREIKLPTLGSAGGFHAKKGVDKTFYSFTSFNYPTKIFCLDMATGESTPYFPNEGKFKPEDYCVEQQFATSKDGTQVPYFIVYKKGMKQDGSNPLHLYSYGGFNQSMTPFFSPSNIMMMDAGGIYVLACLRGGNEYGEAWHKGGMKENKQNVFDDFIAVAEQLIDKKYTSSERLAISGGSNGGLLVGACLVQRPDLYAVAFPQVGVLDMLRYQKFTIGWAWAVEYGTSDVKEEFDYLIKYSPLHNIKKGVRYPATMVMTSDHDDRVVPAHSFKFGATLQAAQGCSKPILLRIESNAGHGAGKPTYKMLDEKADMFSFMFYHMNYTPKL